MVSSKTPPDLVAALNSLLTGALRAPAVQAAYAQQGIVLVRRLERGDWATLILEKP